MTLDEDISRVLPELKDIEILKGFSSNKAPILIKNKTKLTLRHLLTHSSGLCKYRSPSTHLPHLIHTSIRSLLPQNQKVSEIPQQGRLESSFQLNYRTLPLSPPLRTRNLIRIWCRCRLGRQGRRTLHLPIPLRLPSNPHLAAPKPHQLHIPSHGRPFQVRQSHEHGRTQRRPIQIRHDEITRCGNHSESWQASARRIR